MNVREAIAAAVERLDGADATRDAQLLLLHTLGIPWTTLFTQPERPLSPEEHAAYDAAITRRAGREPIQYINGQQEFYGLMLKVSPAVLIPRPETELLVEAVLARTPQDKQVRIVDVGTGSGAIAIALADLLPLSHVIAVDLSEEALAIARENAAAHGLTHQIRFLQSDLLAALDAEKAFDVVVSNPPYVPETDRESLDRQVREFEPAMALFAGADGLEIYRRLVPQAWTALKPGGLLAMEIGYGQKDTIARQLEGCDGIQFLNDLQGIARVVLAQNPLPRP